MSVDPDPLAVVFACGMDISKRLGEKSPGFPRKVETLIEMVEENLGNATGAPFKITFHPRNFQSKAFLGSVEVFEHKAHIYYDRDRSLCWRRFVVTKEMCHLLFAPHGSAHLASTQEQIEQLIVSIFAGLENIDYDKDHAASTEVSTIFMALEILLPHSERKNIPPDADVLEVAKTYRIPEQMVRMYLSRGYRAVMDKAYNMPARVPGVDDAGL